MRPALWLRLAAGMALIGSPHPVVSIWHAHRSAAAERFAPVREAFARGQGEQALVHREGLRVRVSAVAQTSARFLRCLLDGGSLAGALDAAGPGFAFDQWLQQALVQGWLHAVELQPA